jgi:transposase
MIKTDGRKLSHEATEHLRIHAVRCVRENGEKPSAVMKALGLSRTAIYPWLRVYDRHGIEGLRGSKSDGPKPKLTDKQCAQVRKWIVGKDPRQYSFDFGLWTRKIVADLIKRKFGVDIGLTAVGRLLAKMDITPQKPLRRAYERDEQAVNEWKCQAYPKLKSRAKRASADIFFLDEAGFSSEPNLCRTYGLKGSTPVVLTSGQRQKVNAISAISANGAFWSDAYTGTLNAALFASFLKKFMARRNRKVFLVVDGHPSHKAKAVKEYVKRLRGKLELHFLPPYAPDLNPDEFVWHYAKKNGVCKKPLRKNESLKSRVEEDMAGIKKNKRLVRSFFCAKSVLYTKD